MLLSDDHLWPMLASSLISAGAALGGIAGGAAYTARSQKREAKLTPFYKDLNETFERLRASLSD